MPSNATVYFVSGSNRGVGLAIVKILAGRSNTVVYAGCRSPENAEELQTIAALRPHSFKIVKAESTSASDMAAISQQIASEQGHLDVLWANAGVLSSTTLASGMTVESLQEHFNVNTIGPILQFQALSSLLLRSQNPKFVTTSSSVGSLQGVADFGAYNSAYSISKAASNMAVRQIWAEYKDRNLACLSIHPGLVDTELAASSVNALRQADIPLEGSLQLFAPAKAAQNMLEIVDKSDASSAKGELYNGPTQSLMPF